MTWKRAIARITVGGEAGFRGTGALVSETGLVLTAFHVVADHEKSVAAGVAKFHEVTLLVVFGDPKSPATVWKSGDGTAVVTNHYSIDDDWALLQLCGTPVKVEAVPLPLAAPSELARDFTTFGFPRVASEKQEGGDYAGQLLGPLDAQIRKIELGVALLPVGERMGGISGAPCLVNGAIVGVIQQSLADENDKAVKASLYMFPIARAVDRFAGLVGVDDTRVPFDTIVEASLPDDAAILSRAGERLGLPAARRARPQVARCALAKDVSIVAKAFWDAQLDPLRQAAPLIDAVGAMRLHADAIVKLTRARKAAKTPLLASTTRRIYNWYLRRTVADEEWDPNRVVVLRMRSNEEEQPGPASPERDLEPTVTRIRDVLVERQIGQKLISGMLSNDPDQTAEQKANRLFWLCLVGELRPDVVDGLTKRLPNAQLVLGLTSAGVFPEAARDRFAAITPTLSATQENDFLESWESAASLLKVPVEQEDDES